MHNNDCGKYKNMKKKKKLLLMFGPQPQGRNSSTRQVSESLVLQHTTLDVLFLPLISTLLVLMQTHSEAQKQRGSLWRKWCKMGVSLVGVRVWNWRRRRSFIVIQNIYNEIQCGQQSLVATTILIKCITVKQNLTALTVKFCLTV